MDQATAEPPVRRGAAPRPAAGLLCWTAVFSVVASACLGLLTWALVVLHALSYGMLAIVSPETAAVAPDGGRYGLALGVGVTVQVACAVILASLAPRTGIRSWPLVAQGLLVAVLAAALGCAALLLTLGIDPVDFLLGV